MEEKRKKRKQYDISFIFDKFAKGTEYRVSSKFKKFLNQIIINFIENICVKSIAIADVYGRKTVKEKDLRAVSILLGFKLSDKVKENYPGHGRVEKELRKHIPLNVSKDMHVLLGFHVYRMLEEIYDRMRKVMDENKVKTFDVKIYKIIASDSKIAHFTGAYVPS